MENRPPGGDTWTSTSTTGSRTTPTGRRSSSRWRWCRSVAWTPIGAIGNYWASPHEPTDDEVDLLQALADSTAVAMENVRVWSELEVRVADRTAKLQEAIELNERTLGTMAHEIRNALAAAGGFLDIALRRLDTEAAEVLREHLELAHRAAEDGQRILDDQLAAAKDRAGALTVRTSSVDLAELLGEMAATFAALRPDNAVKVVDAARGPAAGADRPPPPDARAAQPDVQRAQVHRRRRGPAERVGARRRDGGPGRRRHGDRDRRGRPRPSLRELGAGRLRGAVRPAGGHRVGAPVRPSRRGAARRPASRWTQSSAAARRSRSCWRCRRGEPPPSRISCRSGVAASRCGSPCAR